MKITKRSKWVDTTHLEIAYSWKNEPDSGFCFPCDKYGNIKTDEMAEAGLENLRMCRANEGNKFYGPFRERRVSRHFEPAEGQCTCGATVYLSLSLVNSCDKCKQEYNASGQLLAPRSQWGEDTGESISEIMQGNLPMGGDNG